MHKMHPEAASAARAGFSSSVADGVICPPLALALRAMLTAASCSGVSPRTVEAKLASRPDGRYVPTLQKPAALEG